MPYNHIFNPIQIGSMTAKNRLLMSAMSVNFGVDETLKITYQLIDYFLARAKGGVGMMLLGGGAIHPSGLELPKLPALWDDDCIPALNKMVETMKPYNVRFGVQLLHGGRQSYHKEKVAPSALQAMAVVKGIPRALTNSEINDLVQAFGDSALRCQKAGFDFVEIHAAHGYLINQFLSANANIREDEYGGSFNNRIRFLLEIVRDIKQKTGADFPIGIRYNGDDYIENGWTLAEALALAPILEAEGVAYLHISAGVYGSKQLTIPSMYVKHGCFIHLADQIKTRATIPVVAVGRIKHPDLAEQIIAEGKADIVAMGRALLADPNLPNKSQEGDLTKIRHCIGCCLGCIHNVLQLEEASCVVNPDVGREYLLKKADDKTRQAKTILVIGAGPAGLAAARILSQRGHTVTVVEEKGKIGGLIKLAAKAPYRSEIYDIISFYENELESLEVPIYLNQKLNVQWLKASQILPELIIIASGSMPEIPTIKGLFDTSMDIFTVLDVFNENEVPGDRILIIGGGQMALLCADFLSEKGKTVSVLNRQQHFAGEMSSNDRFYLRERLNNKNIHLYKKVQKLLFFDNGVEFQSSDQTIKLNEMDTVIIAENMTPIKQVKNLLKDLNIESYFIGDANKPRHLMYAVSEAEELAKSI